MKPLLGVLLVLLTHFVAFAQSPDYLSIRKRNGRVVKNFYTGSYIQLITTDNSYLEGPIKAIRADSLFVLLYDVRVYRGLYSTVRDTISVQTIGLHHRDISRVQLQTKSSAFQHLVPPLMMIGGAGYIVLNVINGAIQNQPITSAGNLRKLGTAAGLFGVGFLLHKLFASDGFSKARHRIVYVDL